MIKTFDVENETNENHAEVNSSTNNDNQKVTNESNSTTKSWWSSLVRFFHFGHNLNEHKTQINSNSTNHQSSPFINGNYLSNIKSRRSLHGDSFS